MDAWTSRPDERAAFAAIDSHLPDMPVENASGNAKVYGDCTYIHLLLHHHLLLLRFHKALSGRERLKQVTLLLTRACNLRCSYCYGPDLFRQAK